MVQVEPDLAKRVRDLQTRIGSDAELLAVLLEAQRALLRSDDARARGDLEGAQRAEAIARASIAPISSSRSPSSMMRRAIRPPLSSSSGAFCEYIGVMATTRGSGPSVGRMASTIWSMR